jgi:hypothetical protein
MELRNGLLIFLRRTFKMAFFVIGLVVGISVTAIVMQILEPRYVGTLMVDKTDQSKTLLYLDINREPDKVGELKNVSMDVKIVDYFGSQE